MKREEILKRVSSIFEDIFGVELSQVHPTLSPDQLENWDSLNHVHLISAIEEKFNVVLSAEEQSDMLSVDLILDILQDRLSSAQQ